MLSFDLRALEAQAATVEADLAPDDPIWEEGDPVPATPLRVRGRLSAAGPGRFYWHGTLAGDVTLPCRRCLVDASVHVEDEAHVIFAEADTDDVDDDPDVYVLDPRARELDLRPALREQWLLVAPGYALCREECRGLCPTCGADLNAGPCQCPPVQDARWNALRKPDSQAE